MNKRIKKKKITLREKREQKILKEFVKTIKRVATRQVVMMSSVPPTPSFEQQYRMIEEAYRGVCENAGYTVSDIVLSQSDHPGVINCEITLRPNYFPIDIKIIKGRRLTPTESDMVAVQDPVDTSETDIWPIDKMFTIGFKVYHSETSILMWVNFDSEFRTKIIDSGLYTWKFVISINDMAPFVYESDGWMKDHIEEDKYNKNVWYFKEPFDIPLKIGNVIKIKCVITEIETTRDRIISDKWKLGAGDYWDPHPRSRRFYRK